MLAEAALRVEALTASELGITAADSRELTRITQFVRDEQFAHCLRIATLVRNIWCSQKPPPIPLRLATLYRQYTFPKATMHQSLHCFRRSYPASVRIIKTDTVGNTEITKACCMV